MNPARIVLWGCLAWLGAAFLWLGHFPVPDRVVLWPLIGVSAVIGAVIVLVVLAWLWFFLRAKWVEGRERRQARRTWTVIRQAAEGEVRPGVGRLYLNGQVQDIRPSGVLDLTRFGQRPSRYRKGSR